MSPHRAPLTSAVANAGSGMAVDQATVFVVDDDEAVRESLRLLLETHGHAVRDFASGQDLLTGVSEASSGCLVLDYHMPALDGLDLLHALRARNLTWPTILITGLCDERLRRRAEGAGVRVILEKPFSDETLLDAVAGALADYDGSSPAG